jgi:polysaccharide biosynthesis protein PslA
MLGRTGFAISAWLVECCAILGLSVTTGAGYHLIAYGNIGSLEQYTQVGLIAALAYTLPFVFRDEYHIHDYMEGRRSPRRTTWIWTYAFVFLGAIGFLTKTTGMVSRGWLALFYLLGPLALIMVTELIRAMLERAIDAGRVRPRRLMLVGEAADIERIEEVLSSAHNGARVVATVPVSLRKPAAADSGSEATFEAAFSEAVAEARRSRVDDVVLFADWSNHRIMEAAISAFAVLPTALHLGASDLIGRFRKAHIWRFADLTTVSLTVPPLSPFEASLKRAFDLVVSASALLLLAPLFCLIALAVKFESPGPVFFRQRRRGFNHEEFRIWKFRTMSSLDDGDEIKQAEKNDRRITRIGRYLRRLNFDELPQLINVLRGEMSLVGPRPHAVAHDRHYEERILTYPRRLNVRPGITGWAQVHGFRGATQTDEAMQNRLRHDLYYIDNWSLGLDLYILLLTVVSPRAYRNAC